MELEIIKNFCLENNFKLVKILSSNLRKDTAVVLVTKENNKFILKIHGQEIPKVFKKKFDNELLFYSKNSGDNLLALISSGDNYFLLSFYGRAIRDLLDDVIDSEWTEIKENNLLQATLSLSDWFFFKNSKNFVPNNDEQNLTVEALFDRIGNLVSSGPPNTVRPKFEYFILRQVFKIIRGSLQKKLKKLIINWSIKNSKLMSENGHNDFHIRNVLSDETFKKLKLIDFENYASPGTWIAEILYFYATLHVCFYTKPIFQKQIENNLIDFIIKKEPQINEEELYSLFRVFCLAAEVNSRFRLRNQGIKFSSIIQFSLSVYLL